MTTLPFGVSQFTTKPWSFEEDVAAFIRLGIRHIELVEDKLDPRRYGEQLGALAAAGLTISGVQPSVRTVFGSRMTPDPRDPGARVARLRGSIERLARFAPGAPFIVNTGAEPRGDMAAAMQATAAALHELGPIAADHGVTLALEPLNPSSMNVESMIWTVDQALDVIARADHPAVGLCLDYWNVWQNAEIAAAIGRAGARILTVQMGGWRSPHSFADRRPLGDGPPPLRALIAATQAAGYRGAYVLELFSDDVPDSLFAGDLAAVLTESRAAFAAACG